MLVTVRLLASLGRYLGSEVRLQEARTVAEVLQELSARGGAGLESELFPGGCLNPTLTILVNGRNVLFLDGVETRLAPGDTMTVFPQIGGGQQGQN